MNFERAVQKVLNDDFLDSFFLKELVADGTVSLKNSIWGRVMAPFHLNNTYGSES